ncbi:hypothetical protein, partial [Citrobacter freundii]|uniref:hypothetical protein n=1 Tax=Citrobacter freundii TaxID=546 RepID=UPI0019D0ED25
QLMDATQLLNSQREADVANFAQPSIRKFKNPAFNGVMATGNTPVQWHMKPHCRCREFVSPIIAPENRQKTKQRLWQRSLQMQ